MQGGESDRRSSAHHYSHKLALSKSAFAFSNFRLCAPGATTGRRSPSVVDGLLDLGDHIQHMGVRLLYSS